MAKKKFVFNKQRSLKIGIISGAVVVLGLVIYFGYNMVFKAESVTNPVKNKTVLSDSTGQTIGSSETLITINDAPPSGYTLLQGATPVSIEAENAILSGNMTAKNDAAASGGKVVSVDNSQSCSSADKAVFKLDASSAPGNYYLWGRVYFPSTNDNSFWVKVDAGTAMNSTDYNYNVWHWNNKLDDVVKTISFNSQHDLTFYCRENGSILDKIILTTNSSYTPSGM